MAKITREEMIEALCANLKTMNQPRVDRGEGTQASLDTYIAAERARYIKMGDTELTNTYILNCAPPSDAKMPGNIAADPIEGVRVLVRHDQGPVPVAVLYFPKASIALGAADGSVTIPLKLALIAAEMLIQITGQEAAPV